MQLLEEFQRWVAQIVEPAGMFLLPPDPTVLGDKVFNFSSIDERHRDALGIAGQGDEQGVDGGDSAHKTGILAFCGSTLDQLKIPQFEAVGTMWRHPVQEPWNNPKNCSRDQLLAYVAGCWRTDRGDIAKRLLIATEERSNTCQNVERDVPGSTKNPPIGDPVFPHEHMFLRVCAGDRLAHWDLLGQWLLQVSIDSVKLQDDPEINQLLVESIICCRLDHFVRQIPDYRARLNQYWGGWRKQQQIADALVGVVEIELERYEGFVGIAFPPIPLNTIKEIVEALATAMEEVKRGQIPHLLDPTKINLILEDTKDLIEAVKKDAEAQIRYYLDLGPKLVAIAGRFVRQFASGGPSIDWIFGHANDDDIRTSLREISAKLDQLIEFMEHGLGKVVANEMREQNAALLLALSNKRALVLVYPAIRTIDNPANRDARAALLDSLKRDTGEVVVAASASAQLSLASAHVCVEAFLAVLAAAATLIRYDRPLYKEFVLAWCDQVVSALEDALAPKPRVAPVGGRQSLGQLDALLPSLRDAEDAALKIPPSIQTMKVYWGLQRNHHPSKERPGNREREGGWTREYWQENAYGSKLHSFNVARGQWELDGLLQDSRTLYEQPELRASIPGFDRTSWWALTLDFGGPPLDRAMDMKREADRITALSRKLPVRTAVDAQVKRLRSTIELAKNMRSAIAEA